MHAEGAFLDFAAGGDQGIVAALRSDIELRLQHNGNEYTHHLPAWTQGIERSASFHFGPVCFSSRGDWIDSVDFPEAGKQNYLNEAEANYRWKEILKEALEQPHSEAEVAGLASPVYEVVRKCPAVLSVTVRGYEREYSRKLARMVCKTALDSTSLCFQNSDFFRQQALHDERLPPFSTSGILESNGFLWLPGSRLVRMPVLPPAEALETWNSFELFHDPIGQILWGILDPSAHSHPRLSSRWATALDWLGEGCREPSDAVALAKMAASLDVLSNGGRCKGILQMVSNLSGLRAEEQVMRSGEPMTLAKVIEGIYNHGRSRILHNHHDRLAPFTRERAQAEQIATAVLLEAALRLHAYNGDDEDDEAFRTMPQTSDPR
jgi:hypothetical protein